MNGFDNIEFPSDFDDLSKYAPALNKLQGKQECFVVPEHYFEESPDITNAHTVIPGEEGFIVPENYFEELAGRIIALANIPEIKDKEGFSIPENYFENFADDVLSHAGLHSLNSKDGFEIPENYFGEFDSELNTKLALDNLKQDEGFAVPENYFDKFTERITAQASLEDAIEKQSVVPAGYFDSLADRITERIQKEQGGKKKEDGGRIIVFAEVLKRYSRPLAVAASAALLISAAYWFMNREQPVQDKLAYVPVKADTLKMQIVPGHHEVAQEKPATVKVPRKINPAPVNDVQLANNDIMEQSDLIDVNTVAEFIDNNTDIDLGQQQMTDPSIDADVINEVIDVNDILSGVNNK